MSQWKIELTQCAERLFGQERIRSLYRDLCIRRYRRAGCIFIHIPKAAGTSVAEAVLGRRAGHFTAGEIRRALGPERYDRLFSFSVTRHPVDRLISAYRYAASGGGTQGGIRNPPLYRGPAFRSFSAFLHEWLVHQDFREIDVIFRPQWWYVYDNDHCLVDYIGRVEDLSALEERLSEVLRRRIRIAHRNATIRERQDSDRLSRKDEATIRELYGIDFECFGYELGSDADPAGTPGELGFPAAANEPGADGPHGPRLN